MREEVLHYAWRFKHIDFHGLKTTSGEPITLLQMGYYNTNAGPDFLEAKIKIGDTIWAGNIEMHIKSSDWLKHRHHEDPQYQNVILHVVKEHDIEIKNNADVTIPTCIISEEYLLPIHHHYEELISQNKWIPCQSLIADIDSIHRFSMINKMTVERLEQKIKYWRNLWIKIDKSWQQLLFVMISRALGQKVNADAFEELATRTDYRLLRKKSDNIQVIESILYGQAAQLDKTIQDPYYMSLQKEYSFLKKKYMLSPSSSLSWKFLRLRPANFPTIRLAQLSKLIEENKINFDHIIHSKVDELMRNFDDIGTSPYWNTHYTFGNSSSYKIKKMGKSRIEIILINAVVPLLFMYGTERSDHNLKDKALALLQQIKPEKNTIIDQWKNLGLDITSAYDTQGLLHLKKTYCDSKRCLECNIGHKIISQ